MSNPKETIRQHSADHGAVAAPHGTNMLVDITKRMAAEQALRGTQETFRQLIENSPFGVYVVDADFRLAMVSAGAQGVFENVRPLIGRDFAEVLRVVWPEPAASEFIALFRRTLETGENYRSATTVGERADTRKTEAYDWKIERIGLPDGRPGVVCHFYDWTERQRLEAAVSESEARLAAELAGMTRLHQLSLRLAGFADLEEVMREVMEAAAELLGSDRSTAQLLDPMDGSLRLVAAKGFEPDFPDFAEQFKAVTSAGFTTCAAVLRGRERVTVDDLATNPFFSELAEFVRPMGIAAAMSTPLLAGDETLLGVFTLYWKTPHEPDEHDLRLLDLYVQQAARQVERRAAERALRESQEQLAIQVADLETLRQLSLRVATTRDGTAALNDVLETALMLVGASKGNVQLYDPTDDTLMFIAHRGFGEAFLECFKKVPMGFSCCGAAMEKRERVIIEDVFADDRFGDLGPLYSRHGFVAVQSTPFFSSDGRLLGMFSTHFAQPHRFSERDLRLLDQVAQQAGRIVERTTARDALRDRQVWLEGQREALEAAVNGASLETSLGVLVRTAREAVGQNARAGFYLANEQGTALRHVVGMPADYAAAIDGFEVGPDSLACGLATATGKAVLTTDVRNEPLWQPWLGLAEKFDFRGCWSFPIQTAARKFVGTLAIYSRDPREATERDVELAELLTHTAAIIISRHREAEERKHAEQTLRESEYRYRQLASLLPVAVYTCDATGLITYYNEQAALLWGQAPRLGDADSRFCGSYELVLADGVLLPHDECPMALALAEGKSYREEEVKIRRPDGSEIVVRVNIDPVRDITGRIVGAINVFHDVTELSRAEQALRDADQRKDEFLATLAHELRNPLAPIRSGLEVMRVAKEDPALAEDTLDMMVRQTEQLVRLIDDLMDVSRITRGKLELQLQQVELQEIVRSAVEATRPYIEERGHKLVVSLPTEPALLEVDPHRLTQVLSNLLHNAAKYSPEPGSIELAASKVGEGIEISVKDHGLGIPREKLEEVFEMFAQIGRSGQNGYTGLGIGLTLAKSLVDMHGGTIEVHSEGHDRGTQILVRIPRCLKETASLGHAAPAAANGVHPPKRRVLVVDDNQDGARMLSLAVKMLGNEVRVAHNGLEALEVAAEFRPDVVLLDLGMPLMDGYEAARRIRTEPWGQEVFLVALTGWGQDEDKQRTSDAGFDHHLVKPADPATLQALLAGRGAGAADLTMQRC